MIGLSLMMLLMMRPSEEEEQVMKVSKTPNDPYLDPVDWRHQFAEEWKKSAESSSQVYRPDCSFVRQVLEGKLSDGYLEVVLSPELLRRSGERLGQVLRLILRVPFHPGDYIRLYGDSDNSVVARTHYYRDRSSWFWCLNDVIGSKAVRSIFFPGTHDSGAYTTPRWWYNRFYVTKIYYSYVFNQDNSVYAQLVGGARMLDLRISKHTDPECCFYVNHNELRLHRLDDILTQVKAFLVNGPQEIIILDFHHFHMGFNSKKDHDELAVYIKEELGHHLHPAASTSDPWSVTPQDIWATSGRVLVAYNEAATPARHPFLYPGVRHVWGDKDRLHELTAYMDTHIPPFDDSSTFTCAMVEMTPKPIGIVLNSYSGLRKMASCAGPVVTLRLVQGTWCRGVQAAAVDYIASTGVVAAAVLENTRRSKLYPIPAFNLK